MVFLLLLMKTMWQYWLHMLFCRRCITFLWVGERVVVVVTKWVCVCVQKGTVLTHLHALALVSSESLASAILVIGVDMNVDGAC